MIGYKPWEAEELRTCWDGEMDAGDRPFKLGSGRVAEYGRYVKSPWRAEVRNSPVGSKIKVPFGRTLPTPPPGYTFVQKPSTGLSEDTRPLFARSVAETSSQQWMACWR